MADEELPNELRKIAITTKFWRDFDPNNSTREKRKKTLPKNGGGRPSKLEEPLYDKQGVHLATGKDVCDCLEPECPGCFRNCQRCLSNKCAWECRNKRKFMIVEVEDEELDEENEQKLRKWEGEIEPICHYK